MQLWEIHRHIGMGGDQMVGALAGRRVEERAGDEIREAEAGHYAELIGEVQAMEGARELIAELHVDGSRVILASSARESEVDRYLDLLGARDLVDGWTSADDVDRTKPQPDLVEAALAKSGRPQSAVMVGDSVWDVRAAAAAGLPTLGVLTGGFSEAELREAGAERVFDSIGELRGERGAIAELARR